MPEGETDSFLSVPFQTVQEVPDRMVTVPVRHDMKSFLDQLQGTDAIGPLAVQMDVVKVIVREGLAGASPVPSKRPYNIDPLCQLVEPYRTSQEWIIGQDQFCVRDTALYLTFLGHIQ